MRPSKSDLMDSGNYLTYQLSVARELGSITAAIMLAELINRQKYHNRQKELTNCPKNGCGWFFYTRELCEERTCLTRREQDSAIKILSEQKLIEVKCFGLPAKRHFRVNIHKIDGGDADSKKHSSLYESAKLDCTNPPNHVVRIRQTALYIEDLQEEQQHQHQRQPQENSKSESKTKSVAIDDDDGINANSELLKENGSQKMRQTFSQEGKDKQAESSQKLNSSDDNSQVLAAQIDLIMENVKKSKYPHFSKLFIAKYCKLYGSDAVKSVLRGMFYKKTDAQLARLTNPEGVFVSQITEFYTKLEYNKCI